MGFYAPVKRCKFALPFRLINHFQEIYLKVNQFHVLMKTMQYSRKLQKHIVVEPWAGIVLSYSELLEIKFNKRSRWDVSIIVRYAQYIV